MLQAGPEAMSVGALGVGEDGVCKNSSQVSGGGGDGHNLRQCHHERNTNLFGGGRGPYPNSGGVTDCFGAGASPCERIRGRYFSSEADVVLKGKLPD